MYQRIEQVLWTQFWNNSNGYRKTDFAFEMICVYHSSHPVDVIVACVVSSWCVCRLLFTIHVLLSRLTITFSLDVQELQALGPPASTCPVASPPSWLIALTPTATVGLCCHTRQVALGLVREWWHHQHHSADMPILQQMSTSFNANFSGIICPKALAHGPRCIHHDALST